MRKGSKLICKEAISNALGKPLFKKGEEYEVLYVDNESNEIMVCIEHILCGGEYCTWPIEWVKKKFRIK